MKKYKLKLKWKIIFGIILSIILLLLYMRFISTSGIKVREYTIKDNKLSSFYGLKVVHFTDLHYGMSVDEEKLSYLVEKINKTKPDVVVFTGDLVDRHTSVTNKLSNTLSKYLSSINATYGKYYVKGNHDKVNNSYDLIMSNSGFKSLNGNYEVIYSKDNKTLFIGGMNIDESISNDIIENINLNDYDYKIFLMHYPDELDNILKYNFDLVLSGHSHNGQVRLPVIGKIITPDMAKKYYDPYYKVDNTNLYISGGIGNSVLNFRFFNKPSFNLYRFVDK